MSKDYLLRLAGAAAVSCLAMAGFGANADADTGQVIGTVTVGVNVDQLLR